MIRRVLMTTDTVGGVWTYALELCRALERHGVEVALATMGSPLAPSQAAEAAALPNLQVHESAYRLEWMREPWEDVDAAGAWLLDLERRTAPDVVHLNDYSHGHLPFATPVLVVGHSCVLSWWRAVKGETAPREWDTYRRRVARGLRGADLVAAPTAAMLRWLEEIHGPLQSTLVISNGRRPELFPPLPKEPWVLGAGRLWDEAKNVGALARVAPRLPWPVLVAGEGEHPEGGHAAALETLRPLGRLSPAELAGWLGGASIYALPARYEPFGLSILEAALAGCALVLGDVDSLRELWEGCALFVPPGDDGALAAALNGLIRDVVRRRRLARESRRRALDFTPERMAAGYLQAYQEAGLPRRRVAG
jgi:glycosyltransferase involved in cell wall biosynthesis